MKCPVCKTDHNINAFQQRHCPICDYDGSGWNPLWNNKNSNNLKLKENGKNFTKDS